MNLQLTQFVVSAYHDGTNTPAVLASMIANRVNVIQGIEGNVTCQVVEPLSSIDIEQPVNPAQRQLPLRAPTPTLPQRTDTPAGPVGDIGFAEVPQP